MSPPRAHILVVDDEPNIRKTMAGVLEDEGYAVTSAGDAEEARGDPGEEEQRGGSRRASR